MRIYAPQGVIRLPYPSFAFQGIHDADHVVKRGCFGLSDVAVTKKDHDFFRAFGCGHKRSGDDSVDDMIASGISYQSDGSRSDVFIFPWANRDDVAQMDHERIHAVAFYRECCSVPFGDKLPHLFHHCRLVFQYSLHLQI